jgi:hypothetical protein
MCCIEVSRRDFYTKAKPLTVQPALMYATPERREMTSWKSWGGVQTEQAAADEAARIAAELRTLASGAGFGMEILPAAKVKDAEAAARAKESAADVTVIYPAAGSGALLRALIPAERDAIVFVRHRSGPVYYWYEALSVRYLKSAETPRLTVEDVVVDETEELRWRLRALWAVKNCRGTRIVALGGARGKYAAEAPKAARERFGFDIVEAFYEDFEKRIRDALKDPARGALARRWAERYLAMPGTALETERKFVKNAFVLYGAFMDLMEETGAAAFTIGSCMGTIMPMAETTACLTLSLMNDEGTPAFCESDFVIIPMRQEVTFIDPEYATARWVGMRGVVERNPFYDICR